MTDQDVQARVFAAAEQLAASRTPTVATVREIAHVSNADATKYLRRWREERLHTGATIAALPPELSASAQRVAGLMWAEASTLARADHDAVEAAWRAATSVLEEEIAELVRDLDIASRSHSDAAEWHAAETAALTLERDDARATSTRALSDLEELRETMTREVGRLERDLAESQAIVSTLRDTQAAILTRITSQEPPQ